MSISGTDRAERQGGPSNSWPARDITHPLRRISATANRGMTALSGVDRQGG